MSGSGFIVRVYGIYIDKENGLLVSDERIGDKYITKFPGGGLEYGEGMIDCLKREMLEETGCSFEILSHYYTTDFFVESAFHPGRQVVSIYYLIKPEGNFNIRFSENQFDFVEDVEGAQSFRFVPENKITEDQFTFSIDKHVAKMLMHPS